MPRGLHPRTGPLSKVPYLFFVSKQYTGYSIDQEKLYRHIVHEATAIDMTKCIWSRVGLPEVQASKAMKI